MRRERKAILEEMDKLYQQEQIEYELSCGFGTSEIASAFESDWNTLNDKLAATYGKTVEEYEIMQYEMMNNLVSAGIIPF